MQLCGCHNASEMGYRVHFNKPLWPPRFFATSHHINSLSLLFRERVQGREGRRHRRHGMDRGNLTHLPQPSLPSHAVPRFLTGRRRARTSSTRNMPRPTPLAPSEREAKRAHSILLHCPISHPSAPPQPFPLFHLLALSLS